MSGPDENTTGGIGYYAARLAYWRDRAGGFALRFALIDAIMASNLDPGDRWFLAVLAQHVNHETGTAWPGRATLAKESGFDLRTLQRKVRALEGRWLSVQPSASPLGTDVYTITPMETDLVAPQPGRASNAVAGRGGLVSPLHRQGGASRPHGGAPHPPFATEGGASDPPKGGHPIHRRGGTTPPKPMIYGTEEREISPGSHARQASPGRKSKTPPEPGEVSGVKPVGTPPEPGAHPPASTAANVDQMSKNRQPTLPVEQAYKALYEAATTHPPTIGAAERKAQRKLVNAIGTEAAVALVRDVFACPAVMARFSTIRHIGNAPDAVRVALAEHGPLTPAELEEGRAFMRRMPRHRLAERLREDHRAPTRVELGWIRDLMGAAAAGPVATTPRAQTAQVPLDSDLPMDAEPPASLVTVPTTRGRRPRPAA